jgi:hypothetical protein
MRNLSKLFLTVIMVLSLSIFVAPKKCLSASMVEYGTLDGTGRVSNIKDDKQHFQNLKVKIVLDKIDEQSEYLVKGIADVKLIDDNGLVMKELKKAMKCSAHINPLTNVIKVRFEDGTTLDVKEDNGLYVADYMDPAEDATGLIVLEAIP